MPIPYAMPAEFNILVCMRREVMNYFASVVFIFGVAGCLNDRWAPQSESRNLIDHNHRQEYVSLKGQCHKIFDIIFCLKDSTICRNFRQYLIRAILFSCKLIDYCT